MVALLERAAFAGLVGLVALGAAPALALADNASWGLALTKKGDCVRAVPLLEKAEASFHRPTTASALAGCHVALGELIVARDLYRSLADEKPRVRWTADDRRAQREASEKADGLDVRIPTVSFQVEVPIPGLVLKLQGNEVDGIEAPIPLSPDEKITLEASAPGYEPLSDTLVLSERERRNYPLRLRKTNGDGPGKKPPPKSDTDDAPLTWIGARFRGFLIPKFWMNAFADGGTTMYAPGGAVSLTRRVGSWDFVPSLGFTSYRLGSTAFKPHGAPDTEWEIDESTLGGLTLALDVLYRFPLDEKKTVSFKVGGGVGFGWMFLGDLFRTQSYPKNLKPGDPATYLKCKGPNNPAGTFRYCNQLDKDAERYGQPDKAWGNGGARPIIFPFLALPELGLEWDVHRQVALDFDVGLALSGFMSSAGVRFGF